MRGPQGGVGLVGKSHPTVPRRPLAYALPRSQSVPPVLDGTAQLAQPPHVKGQRRQFVDPQFNPPAKLVENPLDRPWSNIHRGAKSEEVAAPDVFLERDAGFFRT